MSTKFKTGDKVICVGDTPHSTSKDRLLKGSVYVIEAVRQGSYVVKIQGNDEFWCPSRFTLFDDLSILKEKTKMKELDLSDQLVKLDNAEQVINLINKVGKDFNFKVKENIITLKDIKPGRKVFRTDVGTGVIICSSHIYGVLLTEFECVPFMWADKIIFLNKLREGWKLVP